MNETHFDTIVVGGGMAGLVAAAHAAGGGRTLLLEPHPIGGRGHCDERDGFVFNRGPRALYLGGAAERELRALGVDVSRGGAPGTRGGRLWDGGRLYLGVFDPMSTMRTHYLSAGDKMALSVLWVKLRRLDPAEATGTTVTDWLDRSGFDGRVRAILAALIRVATYANAPDLLDAGAALANVQAAATTGVRYLDGGFQTLVDGLRGAAAERGVHFDRRGAAAVENGAVTTADGSTLTARSVVLATGTPDAAASLLGSCPWGDLGPAPAVACLELGLRRIPATRFVMGIDPPTYYSVHCPPARLAPDGGAVVHLMRYLGPDEDPACEDVRTQLHDIVRAAGITAGDIATERFLARMTVSGAMPLASRGGLAGRPPIDATGLPDVLLAGDWVGAEGMLSDAAIASGAAAGRAAAMSAQQAGTLAP